MAPGNLLGRDAELEALGALLVGARPVAVLGEAGVGKTTLVRGAAEMAGLGIREGGALATLAWTPFLALRRAVGDGFRGDLTAVATEVELRVGPDLLFIDDLQWADDDTRDVLTLLAGRVGLVATIRAGDPGGPAALELIRSSGGQVLELAGLSAGASAAIVRRASPAMDPSMIDRLVAQAGGNPLLLEELATRGEPTTNLRRALGNRLDNLSAAGRRSFALLALAGRPLRADELGRAAHELRRSGIAIETDGQLAVRHPLFAEAAVAALSETERRRLHLRLASLLTAPGERARHLAEAGRTSEAAEAAQMAADAAGRPLERASHLELVALMTEGSAGDAARIEAARIFVVAGGSGPARAVRLLEAIEDGADELLVERDALLARAHWETGDLAACRAAYARGRRRPIAPTSLARARLDADEASFVVNVDGDYPTARRILDEAMAAGRTTPMVLGVHAAIRAFHDGEDVLDEALLAYEAAFNDRLDRFSAFRNAKLVTWVSAEHHGYKASLAFVESAIRRLDTPDLAGRVDELRAEAIQVLLSAGRLDDVVRRTDELLERAVSRRGRQLATTMRSIALACQGAADEAIAGLDAIEPSVTEDWEGRGQLLAARIETEILGGRPAAALALYERFRAIPCPDASNAVMMDLVIQWARLDLGQDPGPPLPIQPWPVAAGAHPESEGLGAWFAEDPAMAAGHFADAVALWAGFNRPRELVCHWAHAESLRRSGSPDAERLLRDALGLAESIGFATLAARARRSLRQAGVHVTAGRPGLAPDRSARMTSREREALGLVGRGLATPDIARRMGLGRGTVDQILGAAARKLGAVSRVQAAAILDRDEEGPAKDARPRIIVRDEDDAHAAVLAALEGAEVAVDPAADPALADRVHDDLRRLGRDGATPREVPVGPTLGPDEQHLLARIAEGMSLGEAAESLHVSRRTADRRLDAARCALGVATTAEAIVAFQRRGWRPPD